MTTLSQLESRCRNALGDTVSPYKFSSLQLDEWINDAIRELTLHFPRRLSLALSCTAGDRTYNLPSALRSLLSVEYPAGQAPPRYLKRLPYTDQGFWEAAGCYDLVLPQDASAGNPPQLWISDRPKAGESILAWYEAEHNLLSAPSDETDFLERHLHLLPLYVRWRAWQALSTQDGADPNVLDPLFSNMEAAAARAEASFRRALEQARRAEGGSAVVRWRMDGERTY